MRKSHTELTQEILGTIRAAQVNAAAVMDDAVAPILGERIEEFRQAMGAADLPGSEPVGGYEGSRPNPDTDQAPQSPTDIQRPSTQGGQRGTLRRLPDAEPDDDDDYFNTFRSY